MVVQPSINSLRASGLDIPPQAEQSMETLQELVQHLEDRAKEGTLRSDKDAYALLHAADANSGNDESRNNL